MPFTTAQLEAGAGFFVFDRYAAYWKTTIRPCAHSRLESDPPHKGVEIDETARLLRSAMTGAILLVGLVLSGAAVVADMAGWL